MTISSGNRKVYSFKSVGINEEELEQDNPVVGLNIPIGFMTPLRFGERNGGIFEMHTVMINQVADNFRNLLMTNHGERLGLYDFGANLRPLVSELGSESADSAAIRRITKAVSKYMPFLELETFESFKESPENSVAKIGIKVIYNVPALGVSGRGIEIILYTISSNMH